MDMKHLIHKRGVSFVLAFVMAASCNFNIAAVDAGTTDFVDPQSDNALQRVYDSGNVVLSNEIVPIKNDTYRVKLNINIHNINKFLKEQDSESQTDASVSDDTVSSGAEKTEEKDPGADTSAADQADEPTSESGKAESSSPETNAADGATSESGAADNSASEVNAVSSSSSETDTPARSIPRANAAASLGSKDDAATSKTDATESASPKADAEDRSTSDTNTAESAGSEANTAVDENATSANSESSSPKDTQSESDSDESELEESNYEVRYYIEQGFQVVESSIPENAELNKSESGPYVSWPDLSLDQVKNFKNSVQVKKEEKDDSEETEPQTSADQISGLYREGIVLYAFDTVTLTSDSYYYVPVNLYKYSRDPVSASNSTMKINQAAYDAVEKATGKRPRGISFDKVTTPNAFNGEWNQYNNAIVPGLVKDELDKDGNLQWGEDRNYQYVTANLFGPKDATTSNYRTDYTNVAFPLEIGSNGSYSFDSKKLRAVYDEDTNRIIAKEQDIDPNPRTGGENAQFCPFYTKNGNPQTTQDRNLTYSFGMNMNIQFVIPENGKLADGTPMQFDFSGDDDVWVFVDQKLVLDIGGIHQQKNGTIDFSSGTAKTTDENGRQVDTCNIYRDKGISRKAGTLHTLTIFYLERGAGYSNFKMSCNLLQSSAIEIGKKLEGQTGDTTFHFNAQVGSKPFGDVSFDIYNVNGTSTGKTGKTDGKGNFSLKAGQKAVFSYSNSAVREKISRFGTEMTVQELEAKNYQTDYTVTANGQKPVTTQNSKKADITVPKANASAQTVNLTFTNRLGLGQLTIIKSIVRTQGSDEQDTGADSSQFFTFKIEQYASDATDDAIIKSTITPISTTYEVIYTTGGTGSKTIIDLPWGKYKVTEIPKSAWRYTAKDIEPKVIAVGGDGTLDAQVHCRNYLSNPKWVSGKDSVTNVFIPQTA